MRGDIRHLNPVNIVVSFYHMVKPMLPMHRHQRKPLFIRKQKSCVSLYHSLISWCFPVLDDGVRRGLPHSGELVKLLDEEKMRVQQLLEELRITKATNARRIAELRKELATVRSVMRSYEVQIDSLNRVNTQLTQENRKVRQQYQVAKQKVELLSKERETLTETVARASMLEVYDIAYSQLNAKGRPARRYAQIATLQFDYTVSKNITTEPGMKTLYLRLTRPDGEVMTKDPANLFPFEDKEIAFSAKKDFEYAGEELHDVIYWKVEEILQIGSYRADFFIDGNHVGRLEFEIRK